MPCIGARNDDDIQVLADKIVMAAKVAKQVVPLCVEQAFADRITQFKEEEERTGEDPGNSSGRGEALRELEHQAGADFSPIPDADGIGDPAPKRFKIENGVKTELQPQRPPQEQTQQWTESLSLMAPALPVHPLLSR